MDNYQSPYGGAESKESGADGKFFKGQTTDSITLFKRPPRFEVFGKLGHLPSQYHAFLCGNLYRGIDGWKVAIEYADKMRSVEYPVHLIYPEGWDGQKPNPFYSYEEYEERFLRPILTDVEALRDILRKHRIGELTEQKADDWARRILAQPAKKGGDRGSNQHGIWEAKDNLSNSSITESQSDRAKQNGVHRKTQEKLDRLSASGRQDLLEKISVGEMKVHTAAKLAGIVKPPSQLEIAKRAWNRMNESEHHEFHQILIRCEMKYSLDHCFKRHGVELDIKRKKRRVHVLFDIELHKRMRTKAIYEGKNLREFLEQCVLYYLDNFDNVLPKENVEHQSI